MKIILKLMQEKDVKKCYSIHDVFIFFSKEQAAVREGIVLRLHFLTLWLLSCKRGLYLSYFII